MRSFVVQCAVTSLFLGSSLLAEGPINWSMAQSMGFHGAVKSQRLVSRKLGVDPRTNAKLHIYTPAAWLAFDPAGRIVEESTAASPDGKILAVSHKSYDTNDGQESGDGDNTWKIETQMGANGPAEIKTFRDGVLYTTEIRHYDEQGNVVELTTRDAQGRTAAHATYNYDQGGHSTDFFGWAPGKQFAAHISDRYGADGDLVERSFYDAAGRMVTSFSLKRGVLTSYSQVHDCNCFNGVRTNVDGISYGYQTQPDGSLETTVEKHPGSGDDLELTEAARYSGNNTLLEQLAFTYEQDSHGNWTKRTVSAWDAKSNAMVPIQEDERLLTYY